MLHLQKPVGVAGDAFSSSSSLDPPFHDAKTLSERKKHSASLDLTSDRLFMKLFRTGGIDVAQECGSYFGVELPSCLIMKNKISFCLGITVWRICFVDIAVSCDLLCCCAANLFSFYGGGLNFVCLPLLLANKVDHNQHTHYRDFLARSHLPITWSFLFFFV